MPSDDPWGIKATMKHYKIPEDTPYWFEQTKPDEGLLWVKGSWVAHDRRVSYTRFTLLHEDYVDHLPE
jgi:hypothetical protein